MNRVVFYSWQSDLPNPTNRGFIQAALEKAAQGIANDNSNDDVPVIDRDTKGVPGAPHIAKTILAKVAAADVFVADVSITQGRGEHRPTPNPNVLVELGYALSSLGDARILLLMNDAYGVPGDPPFDLKIYRVMTYNMPEGVTDRSTERLSLQKKLEGAIKAALASFSPQLPPIPSKARSYLAALYDNSSDLYVIDPTTSARSDHYYLFACAPHDDSLSRPLDRAVEGAVVAPKEVGRRHQSGPRQFQSSVAAHSLKSQELPCCAIRQFVRPIRDRSDNICAQMLSD